ncbi:LOW QUALITY PROTEIN: pericentrin [Ctenodactylus gundi]
MHMVQLELTQANLQKEKESALTELREMLNGRRAQELALLQSRQQSELELIREQHAREKEALELRCGQETAELKEKLQSEMQKNVQMIETLKQDWESKRELCLENLRKELFAKHQSEMEELRNQFQKELAEQKNELEKVFQAKTQAEASLKNLEAQHQAEVTKVREDLQLEHCQYLEELELKFREKEKEKQLELENLQTSYEDLKAQSQEEIRHLWSQLKAARSSREELHGKELCAGCGYVAELEHLRQEFMQQQQRDRAQHESELEQLRVYFDSKLRDAEKTYQEDLSLFQQRLQEAKEDPSLGSVEFSPSCMFSEDTSDRENKEHPDQLDLQHERHEHVEDKADGCLSGPDILEWEQPGAALADRHGQELVQGLPSCVQDAAFEVDAQVAARVLGLEAEHKVKLSLLQTELKEEIELLKIENRNLREKLQHETRLKGDLESVKCSLMEDHQKELSKAEKKIQLLKQEFKEKEAEWEVSCEGLKREAEEKVSLMLCQLREEADLEKQSIISRFELREAGMRHLQDQQAAQILDLEQSLREQQGRLRQLEQGLAGAESLLCSRCGQERPEALDGEHALPLQKEDCALQLTLARNRFLEERKEMVERFAVEQDTLLRDVQEKQARELQLLQQRHQQQLLCLQSELESRHQAELASLTAAVESQQQVLLDTRVAELQVKHAAEISALETRHLSNLDALESCYLSEMRTVRDEHRQALELLRADLEEQLRKKDSAHQLILTQELKKLKLKHDEELRFAKDHHNTEMRAIHGEQLEAMARELQGPHQLRGQVLSLSREVEECRTELATLQQRRARENQEDAALVSMLRADADLAQSERRALHEALRRLLGLFGETLRAAIDLKSRISERVGLLLDQAGSSDVDQAPFAAPELEETCPDIALLELDRTLPEGAETSSLAEISSHVCESFFISSESTLECEQPIRRVLQSLSMAVDGLLEMALNSSRQLEEARQLHSCFEKEFSHKNEELAQAVQKHQELLECLREEGTAKAALLLQLHTAEGLLEGLKVEKAGLQDTLAQKEESEQQLVLELESLSRQLQQAAEEQAVLREEHAHLRSQGEARAVEAEAREAALQKVVETLSREHSEARQQSEKDRAALLAQMQVLESEMEDQLLQHRGCAQQAKEVATLKQQLAALDKHLRGQRQFMDEQAVEREHEREEFQQEIQRLEGQLRQTARLRSPSPHVGQCTQLDKEVELLQEKLREKSDECNELVLKKDLADRQVLIQEEEIKHLEETNASTRSQVALLQEELEKHKKIVKELQIVHSRSPEVEELKSIIENLQENQQQLQKDKAEEVERLHEVIGKLQSELAFVGSAAHELSGHQADSLHGELLGSQAEGPAGQSLQADLEASRAAEEALAQLLAEQAREHSQALEALQKRLQAAEEAGTRQLAELKHCVSLWEVEVEAMASRVREFEAVLKAKEVITVQRDLETDALNEQKEAHAAEPGATLSALACSCHSLEQQSPCTTESPELQRLRAQCVRLSHQLQALRQWFLRCHVGTDKQQTSVVPRALPLPHMDIVCEDPLAQGGGSRRLSASPHIWNPRDHVQPAKVLVTLKDTDLHEAEGVMSVLTVCQRQLEAELLLVKNAMGLSLQDSTQAPGSVEGKEKWLEDCHLQGVDLIAQMQQLQEKLNCLAHSVTYGGVDLVESRFRQPQAGRHLSENGSGDSSHDVAEADALPSVDSLSIEKTTWDLTGVIKNGNSLIKSETPNFPIQEKIEFQDRPFFFQTSMPSSLHHAEEVEPQKDLSSWSSPEVLRKDSSLEPQPSLPLTPCSGAVSLHSAKASPQDPAPWLLCSLGGLAEGQSPQWAATASSEHLPVEKVVAEKDVEDFIVTSFDSQDTLRSPPPGLEERDGSEKTPVPIPRGVWQLPGTMKEKAVYAKHMQALLQMVCDESYQILALSESQAFPSALSKGEPCDPLDCLASEGQGLFKVAPKKGEKEPPTVCLSGRREFPQAVQGVLERKQGVEQAELWLSPCGSDPGDHSSPWESREKAMKEQGDVCLTDRSSLLSEIQALRAQLRMTHLQNQEKLQQLCTALTSAEARGSRREHQLRRQVELLAYKVEQEKCIANDLQKTLSEEQERARGVRQLLGVEQSMVQDLQAELRECKEENARLLESLSEVQREVLQLRSLLDGKESDLKAALVELECEREKERALQAQQQEEQLQHLQRESQSSKALEELRVSLEKECAQNSQLCVALKHERTVRDNLRQELQIERSRCEALLAQERGRLSELQRGLEAEKSHRLELSEALQHERLLTEQLSRGVPQPQVQQAVLQKLKAEKARVLELQAALQESQRQALHAQQRLEAQVQECCAELRREKQVSAAERLAVDTTQTQKQELRCCLEREREKTAWLQAELEQLHPRAKEPEGRKYARRRMEPRLSQANAQKGKEWQRDKEKLRELELQRQRDEHKIEQLQQMVKELQSKEAVPGGDGPCRAFPEPGSLQEQQQGLEKIRQQLLCVAGLLTSFISRTVDRTLNDWTLSNEKAVSSLVQTLQGLRSELSTSASSQKKMAAELQVQLVDVLMKDNDSLTEAVSTATREKAELCRALSRLERTLRHHMQKGCVLSRSGRSTWKQDGTVAQNLPRYSESGRPTLAASEEANTYNFKMEKLYLHYLRAESFRKALIYQKKYLLLLIGGFQDSEQETLSMIAHLGVFPSKADKKITVSRPFTKFRTAVRVVIAVLRLRFLVKKWREVDRKGALPQAKGLRPGRRERSTPSPNSRLERSLTASQDSEHSLTEYIHHLEMIQQRLGGVPPGFRVAPEAQRMRRPSSAARTRGQRRGRSRALLLAPARSHRAAPHPPLAARGGSGSAVGGER